MGRVTDSERREVARRLRRAWVNVPDRDPVRHHLRVLREIYEAVGISDGEANAIGLFDRLADLIEPSEPKVKCVAEVKVDGDQLEKLAHDAAVELTGIDRDALLALADECDEMRDDGLPIGPYEVYRIARRIREALGVQDA